MSEQSTQSAPPLSRPDPQASSSSESKSAQSAAALTPELAETIGILLIRIHSAATLWYDRSAITSPLNVLPRSNAPGLTRAALINLPHIDMNSASLAGDVDLLDFMYAWSKQAGGNGRPVQYTCNAAVGPPGPFWQEGQDSPLSVMDQVSAKPGPPLIHVLDWWWQRSDDVLVVNWTEAAVDAAAANGDLETLEWWWNATGSLPGGQARWFKYSQKAVDNGSGNGHVRVLEWFVDKVGSQLGEAAIKYSELAMAKAAASGFLDILKWWIESGFQMQARAVVDAAASTGRMDVLEWCLTEPQVLEQVQFGCSSKYDCLVSRAIRKGDQTLMSWFVERLPNQVCARWNNHARASSAAAMVGNLSAIQWLQERGWLRGTRQELVPNAVGSGKLHVVEWLHYNVPSDDNPAIGWTSESDEFFKATQMGNLEMLDWLLGHGYVPTPKACYYLAASCSGKPSVMDWWLDYEGEFERRKMRDQVLMVAVRMRHFDILDWCLNAGSQFMSPAILHEDCGLLEFAGADGDLEMIRWWGDVAGPEYAFLMMRGAVVEASRNGHTSVLEYCAEHRLLYQMDARYIAWAIAEASDFGRIECLDWWMKHLQAGSRNHGADWMAVFLQAFSRSSRHGPGGKSLLWWTQVFRIQDYGVEPDCPYHRFKATANVAKLVGSLDSAYSLFITMRYTIWPKLAACDVDLHLFQMIFHRHCSKGTAAQVDYLARCRLPTRLVVIESLAAVQKAVKGFNVSVLDWFLKKLGHDFLQTVLQTAAPLSEPVGKWWEAVSEHEQ